MELNKENVQKNILLAKANNQSAFRFLLDNFWLDVYQFQLKRTKSENDAEDITIQTFSKAFDKIGSFDQNYSFKTWLITISKNIHVDILRKKNISIKTDTTQGQEERVNLIADENPTPEDSLIGEQNLAQLLKDVKELKPKYREVIQLRYFQEMSYKEIASQINEPVNNVKVKLLRAKKLLAEVIKNN